MDITNRSLETLPSGPVDCACVIHGDVYDWTYVERLFNMLTRNISSGIRFHVYTEAERPVPAHMIKHVLMDWGMSGPKKSWWYKMQLFDPGHHAGPLLYFDLDTVIIDNIDWICNLPLQFFWTVKDFKYLWRPNHAGINSSIMWWDTQKFHQIWQEFQRQDLLQIVKKYRGDQDYLDAVIQHNSVRFLDPDRIKSWRWQCLHGGWDFSKRSFRAPDLAANIPKYTSVLVFHGQPKPKNCQHSMVIEHWK